MSWAILSDIPVNRLYPRIRRISTYLARAWSKGGGGVIGIVRLG